MQIQLSCFFRLFDGKEIFLTLYQQQLQQQHQQQQHHAPTLPKVEFLLNFFPSLLQQKLQNHKNT